MTTLLRRMPAVAGASDGDKSKHLGWLMLTALGIGATIGAGIFVMPGRIAMYAGPAGILSFLITGFIFLFVGVCYERFARVVPTGVSAYSYVYHSIGEIFAWIVAFGLFLEYSFGASAVAVGWSQYLDRIVDLKLPSFWRGSAIVPVELDLGRDKGVFALQKDSVLWQPKKGEEVPLASIAAATQLAQDSSIPQLGLDSQGMYVIDHAPAETQVPVEGNSTTLDLSKVKVNNQNIKKSFKVYLAPGTTVEAKGMTFTMQPQQGGDETNAVASDIHSVVGKELAPGAKLTIGTAADNSVAITDNDTVSEKHAVMERDQSGKVFITDLESKNGTFVDGIKIKPNERTEVRPSSKVRVGNKEKFEFGINAVSMAVVTVVTLLLIGGGVQKSAKLNFFLVCLKSALLVVFMVAGIQHINPANWQPFMPKGWDGVLSGAAIAVFPYVGFDALYTFARESKSAKDTRIATYFCIGLVAFLYVAVMIIATALAPVFPNGAGSDPNPLFVGTEASAPLANLLMAVGEGWAAKLIAAGAVIGIFNVLLVLSMGGPRIFRNMAEDGLLPPIFAKTTNGNPTFGLICNGVIVGLVAGLVPFEAVTDIMVLGTLVAFVFVCIGAFRLKLVHPMVAIAGALGCILLAFKLGPLVWQVYAITCPVGLVVYFLYGRKHSKLNNPAPTER